MIIKIEKLFKVNYGQKEYESKENLDNGENILISSKGEDNGTYGFFDIRNNYKAPFITVPRTGTIGQAFVQLNDCSVDNNCLVLIPKESLDVETLCQVAFQIRLNKWKYMYGRQITPKRLKLHNIRIEKTKINFKDLFNKLLPKPSPKQKIKENRNFKWVKVKDLCNISKKTALPQNVVSREGDVPYVSSSSKENGVVFFTDEEPNFKGGSLTVAKDGNDGYSFYQPFNFLTSLHNYVLTTKNGNKYLLFYIGALIKKFSYCYNHYYPLNPHRLKNMKIPTPYKNGDVDVEYLEKIVRNSYGFNELKKYL